MISAGKLRLPHLRMHDYSSLTTMSTIGIKGLDSKQRRNVYQTNDYPQSRSITLLDITQITLSILNVILELFWNRLDYVKWNCFGMTRLCCMCKQGGESVNHLFDTLRTAKDLLWLNFYFSKLCMIGFSIWVYYQLIDLCTF